MTTHFETLYLASSWLVLGMALYIRAAMFIPNPKVAHNETYPYLGF